jgi:hypothetical protein
MVDTVIEIRDIDDLDEYNAILSDITNVLMHRGYIYRDEPGIHGAHLYMPEDED